MSFILPKKQPPSRSQQKKNLHKLLVARSDIDAARTACKLFLDRVRDLSDELYYPLFTAIVVCYARPFTNNRPYGALPAIWGKFTSIDKQKLHDDLIAARHELVAHSDMSVRLAKIVPPGAFVGIRNGKELRNGSKIGTETSYYLFRIPRIGQIPALALDLSRRLNAEIEASLENLYGGMELPTKKFRLRIDQGL